MAEVLRSHENLLLVSSVLSSVSVLSFDSLFDHHRTRLKNVIILLLTALSSSIALVVGITAIVLVLDDTDFRISVDVFTAALMGLTPVIAAIPHMTPRRLFVAIKSICDPALNGQLVYVRRGRLPRSIPGCTAKIYIREQVKHRRPPDSKPCVGEKEWHGTVRGYNQIVVRLRDDQNGDPMRWWVACLSTHVLCKPSLVGLDNWQSVLNAQALVADLVRIGDILLERFEAELREELEFNNGVRSSFGASTGSICERLVTQLRLDGWRLTSSETVPKWPKVDESRGRHYRIVFNILAEKSNHFRKRDYSYHALRILQDLEDKGLDEMCTSLQRWLQGWGFQFRSTP